MNANDETIVAQDHCWCSWLLPHTKSALRGSGMRCLADFTLDSDLCLPVGAAPLTLNDPGGRFSVTLSNASEAEHAVPEAVLSAQVIFETQLRFPDERREIDELAHKWLGEVLNVLAFTTNRKFIP